MKTLICIPCMDKVDTLFMECMLRLNLPPDTDWAISRSSLIYDSRNNLAKMAVDGNFDVVLWLDSDMSFPSDLVHKLMSHIDRGHRVISGMYFTRKMPVIPVMCSEIGFKKEPQKGQEANDPATGWTPYTLPADSYEPGSTFKVAAMGMGACMMEVDVIKEVQAKFGLPFSPEPGFGEDYSFCRRCTDLGIDMWCDSSIKLGHIGQTIITEDTWHALKAKQAAKSGQ